LNAWGIAVLELSAVHVFDRPRDKWRSSSRSSRASDKGNHEDAKDTKDARRNSLGMSHA
jgi:hypothetical protein